jgi:hypothetical protein
VPRPRRQTPALRGGRSRVDHSHPNELDPREPRVRRAGIRLLGSRASPTTTVTTPITMTSHPMPSLRVARSRTCRAPRGRVRVAPPRIGYASSGTSLPRRPRTRFPRDPGPQSPAATYQAGSHTRSSRAPEEGCSRGSLVPLVSADPFRSLLPHSDPFREPGQVGTGSDEQFGL